MAEANNDLKKKLRRITFKALKATIKGVIFYAIYFVLWITFLSSVASVIPGLQQAIETFIAIYIILMILGDLTSGTIYQFFFNAARALFMIGYLIFSLNGGMFGISFQNVNLLVDLRIFLAIAMLLSLIDLSKTIVQAIYYMSQKAEYVHI